MDRQGRRDGSTRPDALVVILIVVLVVMGLVGIMLPAFERERKYGNLMRCADNLSHIGKAMLAYAGDYNGAFPVAGGRGARWGAGLRNWSGTDRSAVFGLDPNGAGGEATIGSSLYLLVRYQYATPETFLCPADKGAKRFKPTLYGLRDRNPVDLWDFGPEPTRHVGYAYHMSYGPYALTAASESGFAVAADRNPWMDSPFVKAQGFSQFRPDIARHRGTSEQARCGNSLSHWQLGQNVLYVSGHVQLQQRPFCSVEDDNIYTISGWAQAGDPWGTPPGLGSQPANRKDSLLVNDPPAGREQR